MWFTTPTFYIPPFPALCQVLCHLTPDSCLHCLCAFSPHLYIAGFLPLVAATCNLPPHAHYNYLILRHYRTTPEQQNANMYLPLPARSLGAAKHHIRHLPLPPTCPQNDGGENARKENENENKENGRNENKYWCLWKSEMTQLPNTCL